MSENWVRVRKNSHSCQGNWKHKSEFITRGRVSLLCKTTFGYTVYVGAYFFHHFIFSDIFISKWMSAFWHRNVKVVFVLYRNVTLYISLWSQIVYWYVTSIFRTVFDIKKTCSFMFGILYYKNIKKNRCWCRKIVKSIWNILFIIS